MESRLMLTGAVTGVVFRDYNANGAQDTYEPGVGGVTVSAYDANDNLVATATTSSNPATLGQYALTIPGNTIREKVEFTGLPAGFLAGPNNSATSTGTTNVQYTNTQGGSATASLGINRSSQYTVANPNVAVNDFLFGDQINGPNANSPVVFSYPYNQTGTSSSAPPTTLALAKQVGSVYGMAFQASTNTVYAGAFQKFAVGYGPGGPGAIYAINGSGTGAVTQLVDLNAVFNTNPAGTNPHTNTNYARDTVASFAGAGKIGLGGLALSEDGTTLYAMSLGNRTLYAIPIANPTAAGIRAYPIPIPGDASNPNDIRPFAVAVNDGLVYVGMVDTAQTTQSAANLKAYVYPFNPATGTYGAAPALEFPLNFTRGYADAYASNAAGEWQPWSDTFTGATIKPQPMLTGIAFDNGSMILGFRDRIADQIGNQTQNPANLSDNNTYRPIPAGDLLRASANGNGSWTIENNATATGPLNTSVTTQGANNNQGPGGGRFYYNQAYNPNHLNTSLGSVVQLPGLPTVLTTAFDPTTSLFSGGTRLDSNVNGSNVQGYQLYANAGGPTFGKANGIGGAVALNPLAPLEIGGRVFNDPDANGIKSAGEFGDTGVTVGLYQGNTLVGTTTTTTGGLYVFNASNVAGGIQPNAAYQVRIGAANFASGGALAGTVLTRQAQDAQGLSGSKGALVAGTPVINVATGGAGSDDESNYFGFVQTSTLSGYVYSDASDDGIKQGTEAGLANVPVTISGGSLATPVTVNTDANGFYSLAGLLPGTYTITANPPTGYLVGKDSVGTQGGTVASPTALAATLPAGTVGTNNNFGEVQPVAIIGTVYLDANQSGMLDAGDAGIGGVTVTLTGTDDQGNTVAAQQPSATGTGAFNFAGLRPGTYTLTEAAPAGDVAGIDTPGTQGGTAGTRTIANIGISPGLTGAGYNFGELRPTVNGIVFIDNNRNGTNDNGDGALGGVTVQLVDANNNVVGTAVTQANGAYSIPNVPTGTYTVVETPPAGYATDTPTVVGPVTLNTAGATTVNFGLTTASIAGVVYNDVNGDGQLQATDKALGGITVTLSGGGLAVALTTTTAADGSYVFNGLLGTTAAAPYVLTVGAPAGLSPEAPVAGTAGGTANFTATDSSVAAIALGAGFQAANYQFPEAGAVLSGVAFVDGNGDRRLDPGEFGVANVTITLTDPTNNNAVLQTTTTDANGRYSFPNLAPGTYNVVETVPAGYGTDTNQSRTVYVATGSSVTSQNFGLTLSSLAGNVYLDLPRSGAIAAGDPPLGGLTVTISGGGLAAPLTTTTAADGSYLFTDLPTGTGYVVAVALAAPAAYAPGAATPGSAGGTAGTNTITGIALGDAAAQTSTAATGYNFGELGATIGGVAYVDQNEDGTRQATDPAFDGGEQVLLLDASNNVVATTRTGADGTYSFTGLPAGNYTVQEMTPAGYGTSTVPGPTVATTAGGTSTVDFGLTLATLGGVVYVDNNNDGNPVATDPKLGGILVVLNGTDASGNAIARTTRTLNDGSYLFAGLPAGTYAITPQTPSTYSTGRSAIGAAGGTPQPGAVVNITPNPGQVSLGYNFGVLGATLSGTAFTDLNGDGAYQRNEPVLGGIAVTLQDAAGTTLATTTTLANGTYAFANLPSGTYRIVETPPAGYSSDTPTTLTANLPLTGLPNQNFGSILSSISGHVYLDTNNTGTYETNSPPLAGVTVTLTGGNLAAPLVTTTASDGSYRFAGLLAGTYTVTETQPAAYNEGATTAGSVGGTVAIDSTSAIALPAGIAATDYNFGETGTQIAGVAFLDSNIDGTVEAGEAPVPGLTVTLRDGAGNLIGTTTTANNGAYQFNNLAAGNYTITEGVLAGYGQSTASVIAATVPLAGLADQDYGLTLSSFAGTVFVDRDGTRTADAANPGVAGQVVTLFGTASNGSAVQRSTTTDAAGNYAFTFLLSGIYTVVLAQPADYTFEASIPGNLQGTPVTLAISEVQVGSEEPPTSAQAAGYNFALVGTAIIGTVFVDGNGDGTRQAGEPGQANVAVTLLDGNGAVAGTTQTDANGAYAFPNLPAGNYTVVEAPPAGFGTDTAVRVPVALAGGTPVTANFGLTTTSIAGTVYLDVDRGGTLSAGDPGLGGVTVTLTGGNLAAPLVTTTASDGSYRFAGLLAGNYVVTETQPAAYGEGATTAGSQGGTVAIDVISAIPLSNGVAATGYNFGEVASTVAGTIFVDGNGDGAQQAGEPGQPGVAVALLDGNGAVVATTTTDINGAYSFAGLANGNYTVVETPPVGYGIDTATRVPVALTGAGAPPANFGLTTSSLAGSIYLDGNDNGRPDPGEAGLGGVTVVLIGTDAAGRAVNVATTTADDGTYRFAGLLAGTYSIVESTPGGYVPGTNAAGSLGGTAGADRITGIALGAGVAGTANTFAELLPASLAGTVYKDGNADGRLDVGDSPIAGLTVTLSGTNDQGRPVSQSATTDSSGFYLFASLRPGTYVVTESAPAGYSPAATTPGTTGGTAGTRTLAGVALASGANSTGNNFGEVQGALAGTVVSNGLPTAGATVVVTDGLGRAVASATTDANGAYSIPTLPPGAYTVTAAIPQAGGNPIVQATAVTVTGAATAVGDFATSATGSLSGVAYSDSNNNGVRDPNEPGVAGVVVTLSGTTTAGVPITLTTTTDPTGAYTFANVPYGTYSLTEAPPAGAVAGAATVGTLGGLAASPSVTGITVGATNAGVGTGYNFAEAQPASLAGSVYIDTNKNGRRDADEYGVAHVPVTLTGYDTLGNPVVLATTTADDGTYSFTGLRPGVYAVTESPVDAFQTGTTSVGSAGGTLCCDTGVTGIPLLGGTTAATGYDFADLVRPDCKLGSLSLRHFLQAGPEPASFNAGQRAYRSAEVANLYRTIPQISYYVPTLAQRLAARSGPSAAAVTGHGVRGHVAPSKAATHAAQPKRHAAKATHAKAVHVNHATPRGPAARPGR